MLKQSKRGADRVFLQNAVKSLATNIRFASVDNPVQVITVTSSVPNEGKSLVSVELAKAVASGGKSVLLVECDMRRRSLAPMIGAHARYGIYSVLAGQVQLGAAVVETSQAGMYFLDCEPHIPNPVDILSSKRFHSFVEGLRRVYDYVIFDTPPLSAFIDASVIASVTDGTLLVVRQNFVKRDELVAAYEQLGKANAHVIGAVMNFCDTEKSEYYYSYYAKGGKKDSELEYDAQIPRPAPSVPAQAARPVSRPSTSAAAPAPGASQPRPTAAQPKPSTPGIKPIPQGAHVEPGSTAQFLTGTSYRPRTYTDTDE